MEQKFKRIIKAAQSGGNILLKYFGQNLKVKEKSNFSDFQTRADLESEKTILNILQKNFPDYNIYSEECGHISKKSKYTFVIDPLDGSNNFVLGIPRFSVNIALLKNSTTIFAVVYDPVLAKIYWAEKEKGAFLNGKKIKVNKNYNIKKATVGYTCSYLTPKKLTNRIVEKVDSLGIKRNMRNWAPALDFCLLASGKIEAMINNGNEIYDYLAGKLIAREAGAVITDLKGRKETSGKNNIFLVSNGSMVHRKLVGVLTGI